MGRDKARLRLGRRTLLGHVKAVAQSAGWPVRLIQRDLIERCGPLGGIYTALSTTKSDIVVFLACDMPFVTPELIGKVVKSIGPKQAGAFAEAHGRRGFPFALRREVLPRVLKRIRQENWSLQSLARGAGMVSIQLTELEARQTFNVNTAEDLETARQWLRSSGGQS